jgi:hypothetical protein
MFNDFKDRLASTREESERICKTVECVKTICDTADKELDLYANIIPEFFSYNKEALKIKALYKKLKELDYIRNKVIPTIDVVHAGFLYNEYFAGMNAFIHKFIDEANSEKPENLQLMEKQLQTACQADPLFIDSLFGGKNNVVADEELTEAIRNVEFLVDFLPIIDNMRMSIKSICEKALPLHDKYGFVIHAVRLVANSACSVSNKIINTIMDTYNDINCCLDDKPVVPQKDITLKVF